MSLFGPSFDKVRLQTHLRMSRERIKLIRGKRTNEVKAERKAIADMIYKKEFDKARIRVESVIRKKNELSAEETLELMCDLLLERINLIAAEKVMPADLSETVQTIVWAAMRTQVEELKIVREQLVCRYGAQLAKLEKEKTGRHVNAEVEARLVSVPPSEEAKLAEFESIAADYEVAFDRKDVKSRIGLAPLPPDASALTAPIAPAAGGAAVETPAALAPGGNGSGKPPGGGASSGGASGGGMIGPGIGIGLPVEPPGGFAYFDVHTGGMIGPGGGGYPQPGAGGFPPPGAGGFPPGFYVPPGGGYAPPPPYMGGGGAGGFGAFPMAFGGGFPVATPGYSYPPAGMPTDGAGGHAPPPVAKLASDAPFADEFSKGGYAPLPPPVAPTQMQQVGSTGVGVGFTPAGDLVVTGPPGTTVKVVPQPQLAAAAPPPPPHPATLSSDPSCSLGDAAAMPLPPGADAASAASPPSFEDLEARFAALQTAKQ